MKKLTLVSVLFVVSCIADEDRCGKDQTFVEGSCRPAAVDAGVDGKPDIEPPAAEQGTTDSMDHDGDLSDGEGAEAGKQDMGSGLGKACEDQKACEGLEADYCVLQPGQTVGYCTLTGCDPANDNCPDGYACMDLSVFDPGLPKACVQQ